MGAPIFGNIQLVEFRFKHQIQKDHRWNLMKPSTVFFISLDFFSKDDPTISRWCFQMFFFVLFTLKIGEVLKFDLYIFRWVEATNQMFLFFFARHCCIINVISSIKAIKLC